MGMDDGRGATTVLGASWMLNQEVIFDLRSSKLGIVRADCPAYRSRPQHSSEDKAPPSVAEWNAIPRPPPSAGSGHAVDSSSEENPDDDPVSDDEESGFMRFIWIVAGVAGAFILCCLAYIGRVLLRRIDAQERSKPGQKDMKPMKIGQVDESPQIVTDSQRP